MVLVPEVAAAVEAVGASTPILAAGGIVTGRQMAAAMAMGAHGAWTGSVWLTTAEAETNPVVKEKMLAASSRDTVRSKSRTGKPSRQLRSPWTDAWEAEDAPTPLPMPLQSLVSERAGHWLAHQVEAANIALSSTASCELPLTRFAPGETHPLLRSEFESASAPLVERIEATVQDLLAQAGLAAQAIDTVFFTGGASGIPLLRQRIAACLPQARHVEGDLFGSIGAGLAVDAARRYG